MKTNSIKIFFWLAMFFVLPDFAWAAPSVGNVGGNVDDGQSITISGSGFGSTGPTVTLFDDFESGTVGQDIKTGAGSATIGGWNEIDNGNEKYATDNPHSGNKVFRSINPVYDSIGSDSPNNSIHALIPNSTELFISFWTYVPTGRPWPGEPGYGTLGQGGWNWKVVWIAQDMNMNNHDQDLVMLGDPADNGSWIVYGNNKVWDSDWFTMPQVEKGNWMHFKWYEKGGTANNGIDKIWKLTSTGLQNPVNATNITNMTAGQYRAYVNINGYVRKHGDGVTPEQLFDDVYISTGIGAQARVEIGNASTYESSTNLTLATVNSWSDGSIIATVRQGSFVDGSNAYLYVIDSSGNVSTGYPISFSSASLDTTAPAAPSGLSVL